MEIHDKQLLEDVPHNKQGALHPTHVLFSSNKLVGQDVKH